MGILQRRVLLQRSPVKRANDSVDRRECSTASLNSTTVFNREKSKQATLWLYAMLDLKELPACLKCLSQHPRSWVQDSERVSPLSLTDVSPEVHMDLSSAILPPKLMRAV